VFCISLFEILKFDSQSYNLTLDIVLELNILAFVISDAYDSMFTFSNCLEIL